MIPRLPIRIYFPRPSLQVNAPRVSLSRVMGLAERDVQPLSNEREKGWFGHFFSGLLDWFVAGRGVVLAPTVDTQNALSSPQFSEDVIASENEKTLSRLVPRLTVGSLWSHRTMEELELRQTFYIILTMNDSGLVTSFQPPQSFFHFNRALSDNPPWPTGPGRVAVIMDQNGAVLYAKLPQDLHPVARGMIHLELLRSKSVVGRQNKTPVLRNLMSPWTLEMHEAQIVEKNRITVKNLFSSLMMDPSTLRSASKFVKELSPLGTDVFMIPICLDHNGCIKPDEALPRNRQAEVFVDAKGVLIGFDEVSDSLTSLQKDCLQLLQFYPESQKSIRTLRGKYPMDRLDNILRDSTRRNFLKQMLQYLEHKIESYGLRETVNIQTKIVLSSGDYRNSISGIVDLTAETDQQEGFVVAWTYIRAVQGEFNSSFDYQAEDIPQWIRDILEVMKSRSYNRSTP